MMMRKNRGMVMMKIERICNVLLCYVNYEY